MWDLLYLMDQNVWIWRVARQI